MSKQLKVRTGKRDGAAPREIPAPASLEEIARRIAILVVRRHRRLTALAEEEKDRGDETVFPRA